MEVSYLKYGLALLFVLGLIAGCNALLRAYQEGRITTRIPNRRPRRKLELVESLLLDARHRAVVLRHDNKEHVLILGPQGVHNLAQGDSDAA